MFKVRVKVNDIVDPPGLHFLLTVTSSANGNPNIPAPFAIDSTG